MSGANFFAYLEKILNGVLAFHSTSTDTSTTTWDNTVCHLLPSKLLLACKIIFHDSNGVELSMVD